MDRRTSTPGQTPDSFHSALGSISGRSNRSGTTNGSQPDPAVIASCLLDLGIGENEEDEFAWIAECCVQSELPPGWTCRTDAESGASYYVNQDSLASTWENPLIPHVRRVVEIGRLYLDMPTEGLFQEQKSLLWQSHKEELESWHGPLQDDEGNSYFVSSKDGTSSWHDPRLARAYIYDLQCGLLNHFQNILAAEEDSGCFGGGTPWEVNQGAQPVSSENMPASQERLGLKMARVNLGLQKPEDHTHTLEHMSHAANLMHSTVQNEEETQHHQLLEKVELRRQRKMGRKLSRTIRETVADINNDE